MTTPTSPLVDLSLTGPLAMPQDLVVTFQGRTVSPLTETRVLTSFAAALASASRDPNGLVPLFTARRREPIAAVPAKTVQSWYPVDSGNE